MRQCDRGIQWIADDVVQHAVAFQSSPQVGCALRMQEDENVELLALAPERVKLRIGELVVTHARADRYTTQSELLYCMINLLHGKVGKLEGH